MATMTMKEKKKSGLRFIAILMLLLSLNTGGCNKDETVLTIPVSLTTVPVSNVLPTSATSGGSVLSDGGSPITEKGIVWDTKNLPTISLQSKTNEGPGLGAFASNLTGLEKATKYYVRSYATNSIGTAYGDEINFSTSAELPTVSIGQVESITFTTSSVTGNVVNDDGGAITARGVVWSTSPNPTISLNTKTTQGSGNGSFQNNLIGLNKSTKYYIRSYATNSAGTAYSSEITFNTASIVKIKEIKRGTVTYTFEYDTKFRLKKRYIRVSTVPNFTDSLVFTYTSDKVVLKEYDDTGLYLIQDHTINSFGYSDSYIQTIFSPGSFSLEYETGSQLKTFKKGSAVNFEFLFDQGNMTKFRYLLGLGSFDLEYYMDKTNSLEIGFGIDEDFYNSNFILNHHPLFGLPSKNLIKKSIKVLPSGASSSTPDVMEYSYEFDQDGDVKQITITSKKADGSIVGTSTVAYTKYYF